MPSSNTGNTAVDNIVGEWFAAIGTKQNYRTMVYYAGSGGDTFEFNFDGGYINRSDIKAFMVKDDSRERFDLTLTFVGSNTVKTNRAVPAGWTILIYRDTPKAKPLAAFQDGAIINAVNLDRNANQAIFSVAEMVDRFDSTVTSVESALKDVYAANQKAEQAIRTANTAASQAADAAAKSGQAVVTANSANTKAESATVVAKAAAKDASEAKNIAEGIDGQVKEANKTANAALATAQGIDAKATQALKDSGRALSTANEANKTANSATVTANGVDGKATQAQRTANEALSVANEALGHTTSHLPGTLKNPIRLTGVHLDTLFEPGEYYMDLSAETVGKGYPTERAGTLTVRKTAGVKQIYKVYDAVLTFERLYVNGSWLGWQHYYSVTNKPKPDEIGAMADGGTYNKITLNSVNVGSCYISGDWFYAPKGGISFPTGGGGIHMTDSQYVRVYNDKKFYVSNTEENSILSAGGISGYSINAGGGGVWDNKNRVYSARNPVPWGSVSGIPAYASRWPNWTEIGGKPTVLVSDAGAVGSIAMLLWKGGGSFRSPGAVLSGKLYYCSANGSSRLQTPAAGSWRLMGVVAGGDNAADASNTSLFVRIA